MKRATPFELQAIADELKRLSGDTSTQISFIETDEGYTVGHELYQHIIRPENGQELSLTGDFHVRWVNAKFKGDYLQPEDPDEIEAIEFVSIYADRVFGSFEEELFVDNAEIERIANDRSPAQQRAETIKQLDRVLN